MDIHNLIAQAATAADYEDQTIDTGGQFDNEPAPAGKTPARFIGYVEVGKRKQKPYQGKDKPDCEEVRLYFELNGKKHQREIIIDGVTKTVTNIINVKCAKKTGDKATFAKLLKKMSYGRDIKHIAQMLGEGFLIDIVHNTAEAVEGKPARTYANMRDDDGAWLIGAPSYSDPMTGEMQVVPVPPLTQPIKLLLWNAPTQEQWDSIFIDGTRTAKDAKGLETEVSKNWLQEDIVKGAVNFPGSPLEVMLGGLANLSITDDVIESAEPESENPAAGMEPGQTKQDVSGAANGSTDDALAALGL